MGSPWDARPDAKAGAVSRLGWHEKGVCSATGASGRDLLRVALRRSDGRPGRAFPDVC
jgi:hypothetical protein